MYKTTLLLLLLVMAASATAQQKKHFFDAYQAGMVLHADNFSPTPREWQDLVKNKYATGYIADSMRLLERRGIILFPGARFGMTLGAQKYLGGLAGSKKANRITWTTQLQAAAGRFNSFAYSDHTFMPGDTTDFTETTTRFTQNRVQLNIYNALDVRFRGFLCKRCDYNLGLGALVGSDISNKAAETITATAYQWNSQQRQFINNLQQERIVEGPGVKASWFSLMVPMGFTYNVTEQLGISLVHHYIVMKQNPGYKPTITGEEKQPVEGYQLHFSIVFKPGGKKS